jgi:N-acetyl sugar amidotransferase
MPFKRCTTCIMPETRPDCPFDAEGRCAACVTYAKERTTTDWAKRREEFRAILERYKSKDGSNYDCIVPVSGGKDSTFQVRTILSMGYNPLCVTATTCNLTETGRKNIENLKAQGVDYIEISVDPGFRALVNKIALEKAGDISWPEHVTIFTTPVRMAVQLGIPLIVWGENAQAEYGGPAGEAKKNVLDSKWLNRYGGLCGFSVDDLAKIDGIDKRKLIQFTYPSDEELARVGVTGAYLGYYVPWSGPSNAVTAVAHGMHVWPRRIRGAWHNYENLDNASNGIHEYFMYLKYGFGRSTSQACIAVRRGIISREEALLIAKDDNLFPIEYMDVHIEKVLKKMNMTLEDFIAICDKWTNDKIFVKENGKFVRDHELSIKEIPGVLEW